MLKFRLLVFAWFVGAGLLFIGQTGLHHDASYELGAFYPCCQPAYRIEVFGHSIPLMILPYLGALKTWLYWPILHYLEVTPFILRLPLVLIAGASVCLFGAILHRVSGRRAAIIGSLLLATDGTFLIASAYDFGPIVLLHLFLLAGVLLLLRFNESQKLRYLALAFFLFGLAFWHKALFGWMFGGLAVAAVVVFQARIRALFSWRRAMAAALSLAAGALPLLYYNAATSYPWADDTHLMFTTPFRHFSPERNPFIRPRVPGQWEDFAAATSATTTRQRGTCDRLFRSQPHDFRRSDFRAASGVTHEGGQRWPHRNS